MPTIVIASPKGGAGKTTTTVILGTELAHMNAKVTLIDCDPNRSLSRWASACDKLPRNIQFYSQENISESNIIKTIQKHDVEGGIVLVDLEGIASRLNSRAISQADLVIIPAKGKKLDVEIGVEVIQLIHEEEEQINREIPYALIFTQTTHVRSKEYTQLEKSILDLNIDVIHPELMERSAFSALMAYGGDLRSIPTHGNMTSALTNASEFAKAVYTRLTAVEAAA